MQRGFMDPLDLVLSVLVLRMIDLPKSESPQNQENSNNDKDNISTYNYFYLFQRLLPSLLQLAKDASVDSSADGRLVSKKVEMLLKIVAKLHFEVCFFCSNCKFESCFFFLKSAPPKP